MQKQAINKRRLSALFVAKVQPQARAFLVWDTDQKGLALQVQPSGYRAFKCIYRHCKRPRWFHVGDAKALGLADARSKAAELMLAVVRDGKDPAAEKRIGRQTTTFAALAIRYLEEHAKRRNKSWKQAEALVRRHLLPMWAEREANTITRADVRAVLAGQGHGWAPQRLARSLASGQGRAPFGARNSAAGFVTRIEWPVAWHLETVESGEQIAHSIGPDIHFEARVEHREAVEQKAYGPAVVIASVAVEHRLTPHGSRRGARLRDPPAQYLMTPTQFHSYGYVGPGERR